MGQLIVAICDRPLPRLRDVAPHVPAQLAAITEKAMQRDPELRYQSMPELAAALQAYLGERDPRLLPRELRAAESFAKPTQQRAATSGLQSTVRAPVPSLKPTPKSDVQRVVAMAIAAIVVLAVVAGILVATGPGRSKTAATAEATAPSPAVDKRITVRIPIRPANAKVTVAGKEQPLYTGDLKLTGEPGERFVVTVELNGEKKTIGITIGNDGKADFPAITLPSAASPSASGASPSATTSWPTRSKKDKHDQEYRE